MLQSSAPGNGFAAGDVTEVGWVPRTSPSGANPICCGARANTESARTRIVSAMTRPIAENPSAPIATTQSGEKITPPMLAPLYVMPGAAVGIVVAPPMQHDARSLGSAAMVRSVSAVTLWRYSPETALPMTPTPGKGAAGFP